MTENPAVLFSENIYVVPFVFADIKQLKLKLPDGKTTLVVCYEKSDSKKVVSDGKQCIGKVRLHKGENVITVYSDETFMR